MKNKTKYTEVALLFGWHSVKKEKKKKKKATEKERKKRKYISNRDEIDT